MTEFTESTHLAEALRRLERTQDPRLRDAILDRHLPSASVSAVEGAGAGINTSVRHWPRAPVRVGSESEQEARIHGLTRQRQQGASTRKRLPRIQRRNSAIEVARIDRFWLYAEVDGCVYRRPLYVQQQIQGMTGNQLGKLPVRVLRNRLRIVPVSCSGVGQRPDVGNGGGQPVHDRGVDLDRLFQRHPVARSDCALSQFAA